MVALAVVDEIALPTERLEAEVCSLAAHLAAATCRFLLMIAELDRRVAWGEWGCRSMAHWLSYRCALSLPTAREQVRVGRALEDLPVVTAAFAAGELSYSKVRALVRFTTPERQEELVDLARLTTAAQLETIATAYIGTTRDALTSQLLRRGLHVRYDDDGSGVITMRTTGEGIAKILAAVDQVLDEVPADASADACDDPRSARRADALELVADHALANMNVDVAGNQTRPPVSDLVVHADLAELTDPDSGRGEVLRKLACDSHVSLALDDRGQTLDLGRRTRTPNRAIRRALERRDKHCCRFPGCTNTRWLHAHHVTHWTRNGPTAVDNLVLLCPFHHRAVHEGGWRVRGRVDGTLTFIAPTGRVVPESPGPLARTNTPPPRATAAITTATGERLDLDHTITALVCLMPPDTN